MTYPNISIGIITYNRPHEFDRVVQSYLENILYERDKITWVFHDDGSQKDYLSKYTRLIPKLIILRSHRIGMGASWNKMIRECEQHNEWTLATQDDWLLTEPLDLRLGVSFLNFNRKFGMLRYHKTTGHNGLIHLINEWDTRQAFPNYCFSDNEYVPEMLPYFHLLPPVKNPFYPQADNNLDTWSPYSGGVHLRHKSFTACYGEYDERKGFSDTEYQFWCKVNNGLRDNPDIVPQIAIFPHYCTSRFRDIGQSYRNTSVEQETLK